MNYILNIETSTKNCSVSISYQGKCLHVIEQINKEYKHSELLHIFIKQVLKKCRIHINKIKAICIGSGPGSFTGLRIGLTSAKSLCYILNIPLLSINSLYIMTEIISKKTEYDILIPIISMNMKKKYFILVDNKTRKILTPVKLYSIEENFFFQSYKINKYLILKDDYTKIQSDIKIDTLNSIYPSAKYMGKISQLLYKKKKIENIITFEPIYM